MNFNIQSSFESTFLFSNFLNQIRLKKKSIRKLKRTYFKPTEIFLFLASPVSFVVLIIKGNKLK